MQLILLCVNVEDAMIEIRECANAAEEEFFRNELRAYFERDLFPDPQDEDREYFLGEDYWESAEKLNMRDVDRLRYMLFSRDGVDIGFAMATIYGTEDGKCYLMEFCVLPQYRGGGTGHACAQVFFDWAYANGAEYIELNAHTQQRQRFWKSMGFVDNGVDDWGDPLLMLPPERKVPVSVRPLRNYSDWQLVKLVNGLMREKGKGPLTDEQRDEMSYILARRQYIAFVASRGYREVGVCFVDLQGRITDMYVEPVFRGKNVETMLLRAARA